MKYLVFNLILIFLATRTPNGSQYYDRVGEVLMSDVTFDLSDLYMTVVIGSVSQLKLVLEFSLRFKIQCAFPYFGHYISYHMWSYSNSFRRRDSGKCLFVTLGYMLHSHKGVEQQREFGQFFKEVISKHVTKDQRIPCFMADAERALRGFIEVSAAETLLKYFCVVNCYKL